MTEEASEFIEELEKRFGGSIGYRTYSTWFASSDGTVRNFGVFVYQIDSILHFEDFERKPSLFGIPLGSRKKQPKYEKFEGMINPADISDVTRVAKNQAMNCVLEGRDPARISPATSFQKLFSPLVTRILMKDGSAYFFELINHKEFITHI